MTTTEPEATYKAYRVRVVGEVIVLNASNGDDAKEAATAGLENYVSDAIGAFCIEPGALHATKVRRAPEHDRWANDD
jgi:hypothetical protein